MGISSTEAASSGVRRVERRGREQEIAQTGRLGVEHQVGKRVEQRFRPAAAAEHRLRQVVRERLKRQHDPRRPAFQLGDQFLDLRCRQVQPEDLLRQFTDFVGGEAQRFLTDRQHFALGDQFGQRQIGQRAADQDQMAVGRELGGEGPQPEFGGRRAGQKLNVVENVNNVLLRTDRAGDWRPMRPVR